MQYDYDDEIRTLYDGRKIDVMDDEQLDRATEYLEWFRSAWISKDSMGLFDDFAEAEVYWEGESNQQEYVDDPASNLNIVHPNIETLMGMTVSKNMAPIIEGIGPAEEAYKKPVTAMADYIMRESRFVYKSRKFARRLYKFGTSIIRTMWDFEENMPDIKTVNPAYFFLDPNVVDLEDIKDARFACETRFRSIHSARVKYGNDLADAIFPNYDPIEDVQIFGESRTLGQQFAENHYIHMYLTIVELIEKEDEDDGGNYYDTKIRKIEMSACGVILSDSFVDEESDEYFPKEELPYDIAVDYDREGMIWGKSDLSLVLDIQDQVNDYDDQIRMNTRLFGNPQKVLDPASGIDPELWTNEEGLVLPAIGGMENIGYLSPKPVSQDAVQRRDRAVDHDTSVVSRINAQMMGQRQKGVDTATESLALRESAETVTDPKEDTLQEALSGALEKAVLLCIHYWTDERFFRVTGTNRYVAFNPSELEAIPALEPVDDDFINDFKKNNKKGAKMPQYMTVDDSEGNPITKMAEFSINIDLGTGVQKSKAFNYAVMKEAAAAKMIKKSTYLKYLRDQIHAPITQEEIDEAQMIEQFQLQQVTQAIQTPGGPGQQRPQAQMPGGRQAARMPGTIGLNQSGNPMKPQSPMKGGVDSNATSLRINK